MIESPTLTSLASRMALKLRLYCRCIRDYDMKIKSPCSICELLAEYDAFVAIVQVPRPPIDGKAMRHEAQAAVQNLESERHDD